MFKMKSIIRSLLVLLLVMSFTSCVRDNISDFPMANDNSKVFLSVSINVAGEDSRTTRAEDYTFEPTPFGGEDGNGDHKGETYERTVNNMSMLFFHSDKEDLTDGDVTIDNVVRLPPDTLKRSEIYIMYEEDYSKLYSDRFKNVCLCFIDIIFKYNSINVDLHPFDTI